jgi:hypothetical protein
MSIPPPAGALGLAGSSGTSCAVHGRSQANPSLTVGAQRAPPGLGFRVQGLSCLLVLGAARAIQRRRLLVSSRHGDLTVATTAKSLRHAHAINFVIEVANRPYLRLY